MKYPVFTLLLSLALTACANDPKKVEEASLATANPDSIGIAESLHTFYQWYIETGDELITKVNFIQTKGKHPQLDEAILAQYFAEFMKTGVVSTKLIEDETKFYRACAERWKNEDVKGRYSGFDYDRYYCQSDGDPVEFTKAAVNFRVRGDFAKVRLMLNREGPNHGPREYEMTKENGKWKLSRLRCNSGVAY